MRHTISVLVENKFGVLARVAGTISGRGFNIDSLNVAPTHDSTLSRITMVLNGDEAALSLCTRQLQKLVNVVAITDFKNGPAVARELLLVKVKADAKRRPEVLEIIEVFHAKIVNMTADNLMIELAGDDEKIERLPRAARTLRHRRARPDRPPRPEALRAPLFPCPPKYTPTRTPISASSATKRSPCSATGRKAMPTPST